MKFLAWLFAPSVRELSPAERDDAQAKLLLEAQADDLERRLRQLQRERRIFRRRQEDRPH